MRNSHRSVGGANQGGYPSGHDIHTPTDATCLRLAGLLRPSLRMRAEGWVYRTIRSSFYGSMEEVAIPSQEDPGLFSPTDALQRRRASLCKIVSIIGLLNLDVSPSVRTMHQAVTLPMAYIKM